MTGITQLSGKPQQIRMIAEFVADVRKRTHAEPAKLAHKFETVFAREFDEKMAENILGGIDQYIRAFPEQFTSEQYSEAARTRRIRFAANRCGRLVRTACRADSRFCTGRSFRSRNGCR